MRLTQHGDVVCMVAIVTASISLQSENKMIHYSELKWHTLRPTIFFIDVWAWNVVQPKLARILDRCDQFAYITLYTYHSEVLLYLWQKTWLQYFGRAGFSLVKKTGKHDNDVREPEDVQLLGKAAAKLVDVFCWGPMNEIVGDFETKYVVLRRSSDDRRAGEGRHERNRLS